MRPIWITNTLDPKQSNLEQLPEFSHFDAEHSLDLWQAWLADKAIGLPKATAEYSTDDLNAKGYVGIYKYI